jgi:pimeloyl-ACP methyl ester carboxylesterase
MAGVFKSVEGEKAIMEFYEKRLKSWPVPFEIVNVETRHGSTCAIASGKEGAPPLVLLHGSNSNSLSWMGDAAAYASAFRVYAVDLIGEPGLSAPTRYKPGTEEHALWLDDVLEALSVTKASFIGISLGGWLALDYAIRRTDRVAALALICPAGIGKLKNFLLKAFPYFFLGEWGRKKLRALVMGRAFLSRGPVAKPVEEFLGLIFRNFTPRRDRIPPFSDVELSRLKMPVAIFIGGEDVLIDSYDTRRRAEVLLPRAEIHFDPKIGHFIPTPTAEIVSFLRKANGV